MITPIHVPKLGMTQTNITVVALPKKEGETVQKGDVVVVIETAKVSYEVEAPATGLVFYLKRVKDRVKIGDVLAVITDRRETFEEYRSKLSHNSDERIFTDSEEPMEKGVTLSFEEEEDEETGEKMAPSFTRERGNRKVIKRIPFWGMRRTIAENLHTSLQVGAQLTIVCEADMTEISSFRKQYLLDHPQGNITFVDMMVKILASALQDFPIINSTIIGDEIICWGEYHIGVAVALEQGLVVPVIRDADKKSLMAISREIKKLSEKARRNELDPSHYRGGTFTLSSGGKVETDIITPIINPPENAILAIGKIGPKPAVYRGQLAVRTMTHLCLTHDHRAVDGVPASLFLTRVKEIIEHPDLFERTLR